MVVARFQKQLLKKYFNDILQDQQLLTELNEVNQQLKDIRISRRPEKPPSINELMTDEYYVFLDKLKVNPNDPDLIGNQHYQTYLASRVVSEWKRYKSPDYISLEVNYKLYGQLVKQSNAKSPQPWDLFSQSIGKSVQNYEELNIEIVRTENLPNFSIFLKKKDLSSNKYRVPGKVLDHINKLCQTIVVELVENALEGANSLNAKTVKVDHIIELPHRFYTSKPLFEMSSTFQNLIDRSNRKMKYLSEVKEAFKTVSTNKSVRIIGTFEDEECGNGNCVKQLKERKDSEGNTISTITLYKWNGIEILSESCNKFVSSVNRIAAEVKTCKGGSIEDLKVTKEVKSFIASVVEDVLKRLLLLLKDYAVSNKVHTINSKCTNLLLSQIIAIRGDESVPYTPLYSD